MKAPNRMHFLKWTTVYTLLFFFLAVPAFAKMKMEIFPLKHRRAVEMVPVIKPLLEGVGTVTGIRNQLIVRTTPANLAMVRSILKKLDTASVNLRITVKEGTSRSLQGNDADISADVRLGDKGRIGVSSGSIKHGGVTVSPSLKNSQVTGRIQQRSLMEEGNSFQQVLTQDGQPAVIHITQSIPFTETESGYSRGGFRYRESVVFRDVTRGFSILPRLQGDRVVVEITPVSSRYKGGSIESQDIHTTVGGRLGEWIELGSLSENTDSMNSEILGRSGVKTRASSRVFVKITKEP